MRLDSLESHRLIRLFGLEYFMVQTMTRHISCEVLQLVVRLSREGHRQVNNARIMGVKQGAISKILKRDWQTEYPDQSPLGDRPGAREDRYLLTGFYQIPGEEPS